MLRCGARKMAAILPKSPVLAAGLSLLSAPPRPSPRAATSMRLSLVRGLNPGNGVAFGDIGRPRLLLGFAQRGVDFVRFRAVSDGGSGGNGAGGDGSGSGGWGDGGAGGGGESGSGKDKFFLSWYLMALDKHPVITKAITSALLTLIGDLICQFLIDKVSKLDVRRTFVFTFLGLVLVGPTLHYWYLYLSNLVTLSGGSGAFARLLLDQFIFSPIFIGVFLSAVVALEGKPSQIRPKLQQEWFSSVLANWQLWIPFQFLNFRFVPQKFQVLAANFVALAWNVILSFKAHKEVVLK